MCRLSRPVLPGADSIVTAEHSVQETGGGKPLLKRWAFYLANRIPYWTMRAINGVIAATTRNHTFHPVEYFPWAKEVEARFPAILEETKQLIAHTATLPTVHEIVPTTEYYYSEREWRQVLFYLQGTRIDDHCEAYPNIAAALEQIPGLVLGTISILNAGETIPSHEHVYKGLLIAHLGLIIPGETTEDCAIRVGDDVQRWEEGKILVIDPTYAHDVWNNTDSVRVIVLCEFQRPDMPRALKFLHALYNGVFNASPIGKTMLRRVREKAALHRSVIEQERETTS